MVQSRYTRRGADWWIALVVIVLFFAMLASSILGELTGNGIIINIRQALIITVLILSLIFLAITATRTRSRTR